MTKFTLNLAGGKKGLLQNEASLCKGAKKAEVKMTGQNGATVASKVKLQVACGRRRRQEACPARQGSW